MFIDVTSINMYRRFFCQLTTECFVFSVIVHLIVRIIDGIKVVIVLKCVVHYVVLFGDETESKLHSVSVSEQSQHKL